MSNVTQAYVQTNVSTIGQGELLLMLYDGAIKFLKQAKVKMLEKDYAQKGILISKAIDIVNELASSLNMEKGGSIAENLNNLYFFCTTYLLQANLKMDPNKIDSVVKILSEIRGAYAEIIDKPEVQQALQQISARMASAINANNRPTFSKQSANMGLAGQVHGRAVYGQHSQTTSHSQAPVAGNYDTMPAAQAISSVAMTSSAYGSASNMSVSKQYEKAKNIDENVQVQAEPAPNHIAEVSAQKELSAPAQKSASVKNEISGLSKRPLSSLTPKNSKRMSLYGKVGQSG